MATTIKPAARFAPSDWFTTNYAISTNSERQQSASFQTRQEAHRLRNETDNKTKWDQYDNNTRLSDRIDDIRKWKEILERTLAQLDKEISDLSDAKEEAENALEAKNLPLSVATECLTLRDGRQGIDLVEDEVAAQLRNEVGVIDGAKRELQARVDESFEQICRLQEARQAVVADLHDKNIALGIDIDQYNLTERSPNISFKPDPCRVPKGSVTPLNWEDFSRNNKERADSEMRSSTALREAIHHTLHKTENDLAAQKAASEYAYRKRVHETEQAKDELEWQKANLQEEISKQEAAIRALEEAIRAKNPPQKLAETRLENRTYRPNVELCRDAPQYGLVDEVQQLKTTRLALQEKLKQAKHILDGLEKNLNTVNEQIANKTNSLMLDNRCMDVRQKLATDKLSPTSRNLNITGIARQRSKIIA